MSEFSDRKAGRNEFENFKQPLFFCQSRLNKLSDRFFDMGTSIYYNAAPALFKVLPRAPACRAFPEVWKQQGLSLPENSIKLQDYPHR